MQRDYYPQPVKARPIFSKVVHKLHFAPALTIGPGAFSF